MTTLSIMCYNLFSASIWRKRYRQPDRQAEELSHRKLFGLKHRLRPDVQPEQHISKQKQIPFRRPGRNRKRHND